MLATMKMGTKILAAFVLALLVMLVVGGVAYRGSEALRLSLEDVARAKMPSNNAINQVNEAQTAVARGVATLLLRRADGEMRRSVHEYTSAALKRLDEGTKAYEALPHGEKALAAWKESKALTAAWRTKAEAAIDLTKERERVAAGEASEAALKELDAKGWAAFVTQRQAYSGAEKALNELSELTLKDAEASTARGEEAASSALRGLLIALVLGGVALIGVGLFLGRQIGKTVSTLVAEAGKLRDAVAAGELDVRGDVNLLDQEFRPIVAGINDTMDAFQRPIAVTTEYVSAIGEGRIPPKITDVYRGGFNTIKSSLNGCIDAVNALVADAGMLAKAGVEGRLATRADATRHQGDFRKVVQGVNDTLDAVIGPLNVAARYVDQISKGEIPEKITAAYAGDFNTIKENLNRCVEAVNGLVADAQLLAKAGVEGRLSTRADATRHQGDFRRIVEGVNATLDSVIGPLNVAARYVEQIFQGRIPAPITDRYQGDFNTIKDNLNTCITAVNLLVADAGRLVEAAVAGELSTRADASKHQGDFRTIVEGVNRTLDAVLAPVQEAAGVLDRLAERDLTARVNGDYRGDHAAIKASVNATASALQDALGQVAAAVEQVSAASTQIASSSQSVASGASEQAAALQQTTHSMESVLGITRQATESAMQANTLATSARASAGDGAAAVEQMQVAMAKIKAGAESTSQIIRDINDIAFQTNLLALNAAVEAARAGEAGRGFAVVAEEVRSLALRAKEAAMKTEELIRQSVLQAGEGEAVSKQVATKLGEIVSGIGKVTEIVSEISAASKEQGAGITQVNQAVAEMDKVTQQNAAAAEQSSSAASELNAQSEELAAMVGSFRIDGAGSPTRGLRAPAGASVRSALHAPKAAARPAARLAAKAPVRSAAARPVPSKHAGSALLPMPGQDLVDDAAEAKPQPRAPVGEAFPMEGEVVRDF